MEKLIERVKQSQKTLKTWRNDHTSIEWKEASKLNEILTGIPLNKARGCECVDDLFFLVNRTSINQINNKMNQKFKVQTGKVIMLHGCTPVTDKATDEQIMNLLKLSPAHIKSLETYPENWREICGLDPERSTSSQDDENSVVLTEGDAEADLNGKSRPDNPTDKAIEARKNDLLEMKNQELKGKIISMGGEIPKPSSKVNLVDAIIELERNSGTEK